MRKSHLCLAVILLIGIAVVVVPLFTTFSLDRVGGWGLLATLLILLAIAAFFFEFEAAAVSSREVALVAILGTMSAVLRIPFAAIPSVQPSTYLIICSGYVFGPIAGFMVGAVTALVSNFFLGQGPWTVYQMFAWGLAGVSAAYARRLHLNKLGLVVFGVIWGYVFGWLVNIWFWASFVYPLTWQTFLVTQLNSLWFDTFHAISNALFLGLLGTKTIAILDRFKKRFKWSFVATT
ncbi:MAG: ECF transporter S component [Chloroflexi bacterium]|nr:ECF transporter S component [Chloroflexota bacterium]